MKRFHILNDDTKTVSATKLRDLIISIKSYTNDYPYLDYDIENKYFPPYHLVSEWLTDLEENYKELCIKVQYSSTSRDVLKFSGIKFSEATGIFYKMSDEKLFKFSAYKLNNKAKSTNDGKVLGTVVYISEDIQWEHSDFLDLNGMSEFWLDATEEQITRYKLGD